ncbi:MAG: hypothetical protein ACRD13_09265 [Terriglobales bacterium]
MPGAKEKTMNYGRNSRISILLSLLVALAVAVPIWAQLPPGVPVHRKASPAQTYRLEFTVQQLRAGRVINQRKYEILAAPADRAGSRVDSSSQIPVGTDKGETVYKRVGFTLDAYWGPQGVLMVSASIGSLGRESTASGQPVVRHISAKVSTAIRPNVPTVLATIADTGSNDQYRISLLAVPLQP